MLTGLGYVAGALASIAAILGFFKWVGTKFEKTPEQSDADIDKANQDALNKSKQTGRPS